ncbi:hypothetical protein D3C80_1350340 [compost metagenome]
MPDILDAEAIWVSDGLTPVIRSSDFKLYDADIELAMRGIQESLARTLAYDHLYRETASWRRHVFGRPLHNFGDNKEETEAYDMIVTARNELSQYLQQFIQILHERYIEIDISETNRECARRFLAAHQELFDTD